MESIHQALNRLLWERKPLRESLAHSDAVLSFPTTFPPDESDSQPDRTIGLNGRGASYLPPDDTVDPGYSRSRLRVRHDARSDEPFDDPFDDPHDDPIDKLDERE